MIIHFHPSTDGPFAPSQVEQEGQAVMNEMEAGPGQLLEVLEQHLGLKGKEAADSLRVEQYRQALAEVCQENDQLFCSASFQNEPLATARTLLKWRDELRMALWTFKVEEGMPERLRTLAEVEKKLQMSEMEAELLDAIHPGLYVEMKKRSEMVRGEADRWFQVLISLKEKAHVPLQEINLYEPRDLLHPFFKDLLDTMERNEIRVKEHAFQENSPSPNSDLAKYQHYIRYREQEEFAGNKWEGDGSLVILKGSDNRQLATYMAQVAKNNPDFEPLILKRPGTNLLSRELGREGLPSLGQQQNLADSPIPQLFFLVSALLWKPLDVHRLLEFLNHPDSPIPKGLGRSLAEVVAEKPGRMSQDWRQRIERYCDAVAKDDADEAQNIRDKVRFWLERDLYDDGEDGEQGNGIPKNELYHFYDELRQWAILRSQTEDQSSVRQQAFLLLYTYCQSLLDLLEQSGEETISRLQLDKWLEHVRFNQWYTEQDQQVGSWAVVDCAAAITGNVERLIWWDFIETGDEQSLKWNWWREEEREFLEAKGIQLDDVNRASALREWQMVQPVLRCREQLVIVLPDKVDGEQAIPHPLFSDLEAFAANMDAITYRMDNDPLPAFPKLGEQPQLTAQETYSLPKTPRYWEIDRTDLVAPRKSESYSSLEKLFEYPYQWLLNYQARIRPVPLMQLPDDSRLKGNLAHRVVEEFFKAHQVQDVDPEQDVKPWFDHHFDTLLQQEGAVLLQKGQGNELAHFKEIVQNALKTLIYTLQEGNWQVYELEQKVDGTLYDIPVNATLDLVLQKSNGSRGLLDLKWKGFNYRLNEIAEYRDLQLMLYTHLLNQKANVAANGYFIFTAFSIITRFQDAFPGSYIAGSDGAYKETLDWLLRQMKETHDYRLQEIRKGQVEVAEGLLCGDLEANDRMNGKDLLDLPKGQKDEIKRPSPFNDYKNLVEIY